MPKNNLPSSTSDASKAARDNRANQLNPNNDAYRTSRGQPANRDPGRLDDAARINRGNQLNPSHEAYHGSRKGSKGS